MKSKFPTLCLVIVLFSIIPNLAFAVWWNPFTWKIFNQEQKVNSEISQIETVKNIATTTVSLSKIESVKNKEQSPKKADLVVLNKVPQKIDTNVPVIVKEYKNVIPVKQDQSIEIYPEGCISNSGYSTTTGSSCGDLSSSNIVKSIKNTTTCGQFYMNLKVDSYGEDVSALQTFLFDMDLFKNEDISGRFDENTSKALKMYQKSIGVPTTGVLDSTTRAYLNGVCSNEEPKVTTPSVSVAVPIPEEQPRISIELMNTFEDRAGKGASFEPGWSVTTSPQRTNADWNFNLFIDLPSGREIDYIEIQHDPLNSSTENWSTRKKPLWKDYPLVIFEDGKQLNTEFNQSIYLSSGSHNLRLFGQIEKNHFYGGEVKVYFKNGPLLQKSIPESSYVPAPAECKVIPGPESVPSPVLSIDSNATSSITVVSPNGGDTFQIGKTYRIVWNSINVEKVIIGYTLPGPGSTGYITSVIPNTGYYDWTVGDYRHVDKRIKIGIAGWDQNHNPSIGDYSDDYTAFRECENDINL